MGFIGEFRQRKKLVIFRRKLPIKPNRAGGWGNPPCPAWHRRGNNRKNTMKKHRIFTTSVASVYPHYLAKAEKKGRNRAEVDAIFTWLTGYDSEALQQHLEQRTDFETFFAEAPRLNPNASRITGVICGYRVEEIEDPLMQKIRYLDKLIVELARGKALDKILRT